MEAKTNLITEFRKEIKFGSGHRRIKRYTSTANSSDMRQLTGKAKRN